jgi:hypothetical protein
MLPPKAPLMEGNLEGESRSQTAQSDKPEEPLLKPPGPEIPPINDPSGSSLVTLLRNKPLMSPESGELPARPPCRAVAALRCGSFRRMNLIFGTAGRLEPFAASSGIARPGGWTEDNPGKF